MSDIKLAGPDGKVIEKRPEMSRQDKFNFVFMVFTLMSAKERQMLIKMLRPLRRKLDVNYPNGMTKEDIERDIEKIVVQSVPDEAVNPVPVVAEGGAVEGVSAQPEGDEVGNEVAAAGEEGGC